MKKEKSNKISVYLLKDGIQPNTENNDIKSQSYEDMIETKVLRGSYEKIKMENGFFYYDKSHRSSPSWIKNFFTSSIPDSVALFNQSSKGLYISKILVGSQEKTFIIPFGHGHTMMEKINCVDDFGLKILLNIVDSDSIRKIERRTLSSDPKNTIEQLSKVGSISDFGIDVEQDLVEEITGKPKKEFEKYFGKNLVTGKVAFTLSHKLNVDNIGDFLKDCYEHYQKNTYKDNFAFIDQIKEIKEVDDFNQKLIEKLQDKSQPETDIKLWMAVPEIIDWECIEGFSFKNKKENLIHDISLDEFKKSLTSEQINNLSLDFLKKKKVIAYRTDSDNEQVDWAVFKCLYCEIVTSGNKTVILANGKWYEIAQDFVAIVQNSYDKIIKESSGESLLPAKKEEHEDKYNERLAKSIKNSILMDRKNIVHGGGRSKIEFCDVYDVDKKTFIHVKNYSGSAPLSHLFAQARVSGELFLNDQSFRVKTNKKAPKSLFNPTDVPNASEYKVVYGIMSKEEGDLNLPFFSKVNLKNEIKHLHAIGLKNVALVKALKK